MADNHGQALQRTSKEPGLRSSLERQPFTKEQVEWLHKFLQVLQPQPQLQTSKSDSFTPTCSFSQAGQGLGEDDWQC
ncbi:hypothetical protein KY290_032383 [Solanum tuberosum]|uniref:Uncharacterized protein n=1 Tax=Solanum tuberosum TaxID=4113 RepID=A0ABQ7UC01_SOLTU|nr:hypothetical protein KY290_032383 [Solanum tuberosum]